MGIANFAKIFERNPRGVYNARGKVVNLYVDGENLRFKGMTQKNRNRTNAEESIGRDAFFYLDSIQRRLSNYLNVKFQTIYVYMDGARPHNKCKRPVTDSFDHSVIRETLKSICASREPLYQVVQLDYGESELMMYKQRDRNANLNIMLTMDSDCLSIAYGHYSSVRVLSQDPTTLSYITLTPNDERLESLRQLYGYDLPIDAIQHTTLDTHEMIVNDENYCYDSSDVYDSCVFAHLNSNAIVLYGLDDVAIRMKLPVDVFRVLCALCGTDFTTPLLTASLIGNFLLNIADKSENVNSIVGKNLQALRQCCDYDDDTADFGYIWKKYPIDASIMFVLFTAFYESDLNKCSLPRLYESKSASTKAKAVNEDYAMQMYDYQCSVLRCKSYDEIERDLVQACEIYTLYIETGKMYSVDAKSQQQRPYIIPTIVSPSDYLLKIINHWRRELGTYFTQRRHKRVSPKKRQKISTIHDEDDLTKIKEVSDYCSNPELFESYLKVCIYIHLRNLYNDNRRDL
ncbi:Fen-1 [Phenacoccus solenopsis nudivirus]|nr:Fen-1 [Phenacoccus solenopsis nudivirus]